jgi:hypothetical protein
MANMQADMKDLLIRENELIEQISCETSLSQLSLLISELSRLLIQEQQFYDHLSPEDHLNDPSSN